jgi:hypothetical protein
VRCAWCWCWFSDPFASFTVTGKRRCDEEDFEFERARKRQLGPEVALIRGFARSGGSSIATARSPEDIDVTQARSSSRSLANNTSNAPRPSQLDLHPSEAQLSTITIKTPSQSSQTPSRKPGFSSSIAFWFPHAGMDYALVGRSTEASHIYKTSGLRPLDHDEAPLPTNVTSVSSSSHIYEAFGLRPLLSTKYQPPATSVSSSTARQSKENRRPWIRVTVWFGIFVLLFLGFCFTSWNFASYNLPFFDYHSMIYFWSRSVICVLRIHRH